jgi:uncharacterized membrane protein YciS (DUF1049 family)
MEKITKDTLIPLGLVLTLVVASVSFGVMYQKVEEMRFSVSEVKNQISRIDDKLNDVLLLRSSVSVVKN